MSNSKKTHPSTATLMRIDHSALAAGKRIRDLIVAAARTVVGAKKGVPAVDVEDMFTFAKDNDMFLCITDWSMLESEQIMKISVGTQYSPRTMTEEPAVFVFFEFDPMVDEYESWLCVPAALWDAGPKAIQVAVSKIFQDAVQTLTETPG